MKRFIEELMKNEKVWKSATSNGGCVKFFEKGITGKDKEEKNLIRETNIKYCDSEAEELLVNIVTVEFACGDHQIFVRMVIDELYERYCETGWNGVETLIMANVMHALNMNAKTFETVSDLENYSTIKNKLIVRPLNYRLNERNLNEKVYRRVGDIALVLYAVVSDQDGELNTCKIPREIVERWGEDPQEVLDTALYNTYEYSEPRIYTTIDEALRHDPEKGKFMDETVLNINSNSVPMVTTTKRANGAIAMFLPNVKEKIYELLGTEYYVVFTSIHEAMLHKAGTIDLEKMQRSLRDVNSHFGDEDTLTYNIYRYNSETGNIEIYA